MSSTLRQLIRKSSSLRCKQRYNCSERVLDILGISAWLGHKGVRDISRMEGEAGEVMGSQIRREGYSTLGSLNFILRTEGFC